MDNKVCPVVILKDIAFILLYKGTSNLSQIWRNVPEESRWPL